MGPLMQTNGHDFQGLIDAFVPGEAAVIDDIVVGFEDAVGEPVVALQLITKYLKYMVSPAGFEPATY